MTASFKPTSAPGDPCQPSTPRHPHPHPQPATSVRCQAAAHEDARKLGFDAHPLIAQMWATVQSSCEAGFYRESDWARLRLEFWFASHKMASGQAIGLGLGGDPARAERDAAVPGDQTPRLARSSAKRSRRTWARCGDASSTRAWAERRQSDNWPYQGSSLVLTRCSQPMPGTPEPYGTRRGIPLGWPPPPVEGWLQERVTLSGLGFRSMSALQNV